MSVDPEPPVNEVLSAARRWLVAERKLDLLVIAVSENSLNDEFRDRYPELFDAGNPMTKDFVEKYERCLRMHMGGYVLRAEEFYRAVQMAMAAYAHALVEIWKKRVSDTNTDVQPGSTG